MYITVAAAKDLNGVAFPTKRMGNVRNEIGSIALTNI